MKLKELIAATYAPMHKNGDLNLSVIEPYTNFLIRNKVKGVFMNGSTGDFTSLTIAERMQITKGWHTNKSEDLYLIDHVGDSSLKTARALAEHAADKVDAISALAPFYFRLSSIDKLVMYCKEVAAGAPNLPFYYYHIPVLSGADLNMEEFLKRAEQEIPTLAGIKFTNNNLMDYGHCKNVADKKYDIFFGVDEMFLSSLPLGATGWVGSTYNHLAPLYYQIKDYFEQGNFKDAAELQSKAIRFVEILNAKGGFNGVAKGFMKTLGVDCGPSRFPHTTLSDAEYSSIQKELKQLDIQSYFSK